MYPNVLKWVESVIGDADVRGKKVLEVGAYDVNGSVRPYIESFDPAEYLGVDVQAGPSVDRIVDCENLRAEIPGQWDLVVSTETLEHVRDWRTCVEQMALALKPGGLLLLTTCSPGFPYHPFPGDYWRFTNDELVLILAGIGLEPLTHDVDDQNLGVFTLSRKPIDWVLPSNCRIVWDSLNIPLGRFENA